MAENNQNTMHWILGGALVIIGVSVIAAMVMWNSQADSVTTTSQVNNVAPTIVDQYVTTSADYTQSDNTGGANGELPLVNGGGKLFKVTGTVEDLNGAPDITGVSLRFHETTATNSACTQDDNNCYVVSSCTTVAGPNSDQLDFNCNLILQYYVDSTKNAGGGAAPANDWVAEITVTDGTASNMNNTIHKETTTLLALSIPATISYGTLGLGVFTNNTNNVDMTIEQFGNDEADVTVTSAAAMNCDVRGTIPVANQKWALSDVAWDNVANTALSGSVVDTDINIGYRTIDGVAGDGNATKKVLTWNLQNQASGVEGTCTGTTVIAAIAH